MSQNYAAVQPAAKTDVEVKAVPTPTPGEQDILVKNQSISFNPLEWKIQKLAIFPVPYPYIGGFSFAGTVEKVSSGVTGIKAGDRVATKRTGARRGNDFGAFQRYALAQGDAVTKIPDGVDTDTASAVMLNLATALGAHALVLGLELPPLSSSQTPAPKNQKLLIYGGSSSVGQFAIQLASQAGYTVISTASPTNMRIVEPLGAKAVVNHSQDATAVIKELTAHGPYDFVIDTIALPPTSAIVSTVVAENIKAGGTDTFWGLQPLFGPEHIPDGVKRKDSSFAAELEKPENKDLARWFYDVLVPEGLTSGKIVPPKVEKLEAGLQNVQTAIEMMMKGVSGKKLILDPWRE